MGRSAFVMGGIRSGKSGFGQTLAEHAAEHSGGHVTYIATGRAGDEEMARRIEKHRSSRPAHWRTIEAGDDLPLLISQGTSDQIILVDSVAEWLTNHILARWDLIDRAQLESEIEEQNHFLISSVEDSSAILVLIGHEVGLAPVPVYPMGRTFCDLNGLLNQGLAAVSESVWSLRAGIPQRLK